jgi:hypothetical protein
MRFALALLLAGCVQRSPDPSSGDGWTGPSGHPVSGCRSDADCGSELCARDAACYPAAEIRAVHALWTIAGAAASTTTCSHEPDLYIAFLGRSGEQLGYAPVPCRTGRFTVDKLPIAYVQVELGQNNSGNGITAEIATSGEANLDLPR